MVNEQTARVIGATVSQRLFNTRNGAALEQWRSPVLARPGDSLSDVAGRVSEFTKKLLRHKRGTVPEDITAAMGASTMLRGHEKSGDEVLLGEGALALLKLLDEALEEGKSFGDTKPRYLDLLMQEIVRPAISEEEEDLSDLLDPEDL